MVEEKQKESSGKKDRWIRDHEETINWKGKWIIEKCKSKVEFQTEGTGRFPEQTACLKSLVSPSPLPGVGYFLVTKSCLFMTPWTAAHQASLSLTISQGLLKLMSTESVMPSNHLILCCPLLLLPSAFPSIRVFQAVSLLLIHPVRVASKGFGL